LIRSQGLDSTIFRASVRPPKKGITLRFTLGLLATVAISAGLAGSAHAEWLEAKSPHFIIYADSSPAELRKFGDRLERFDSAVRLIRGMDDPALTDAERLTVFGVGDEDAVGRLLGSDSVLGFYITKASGSFAYVPQKQGFYAQRQNISPLSIFFHEYAHHLQLGRDSIALPAWVTEGFAEFFATAEIMDNGNVRIGLPPMYRQWSVQRYDGLSMTEMMSGSLRNATDRQVASLYGRGWLLTHMLNFDREGRKQLEQYIHDIQKGIDPLQSAKAAFGDDLRSVDRRLDEYLRRSKLETIVIDGARLKSQPIAVRTLSPAEAAIMDVRMRVPIAANRKEGSKLADQARKIAELFPNEPTVLVTLAQAQLKAQHYSEASSAAERAFTINPRLAEAATAVGRAKMELAHEKPAGVDWSEVRSWFLKANRLSSESAEPLLYFYRSFIYANAPPSPSAVKGLEYAVYLAPRDEELRIEAVRQLVLDSQLKQAREYFAPIAYYLHSDLDWRTKKTAIMDALTANNRATALQFLGEELEKRETEDKK
jgi:tetratricopeptide (TPR) repeat protein